MNPMPRAFFSRANRLVLGCLLISTAGTAASQEASTVAPAEVAAAPADSSVAPVDAASDPVRQMQLDAMKQQTAEWGHWGIDPTKYSTWVEHSNRLIPVYTFGITLDLLREEGSVYKDPARLEKLYGTVTEGTVNPTALYYDQTDVHRLQMKAIEAGYSNIILMVFDGMDWQTTRAAAIYKQGEIVYSSGRGTGLSFLDDRRVQTDFGLVCTSPRSGSVKYDVNSQTVLSTDSASTGGYDVRRGGDAPWNEHTRSNYLLGLDRERPHSVTDSAASATSMTSGIKTYNGAINFAVDGEQVIPIARRLQEEEDFKVGVVSNVPIPHATPAAAYANNVTRKDYQDLSRDMLGLPSASHRDQPLPGLDVVIGGGWSPDLKADAGQGDNYLPGNRYLHQSDLERVDVANGGQYVVAQRTSGKSGRRVLMQAARRAIDNDQRLLGFFGTRFDGHLPFQTADGGFDPVLDAKGTEAYTQADLDENPSLAEMTRAALLVLEQAVEGFWLMIEAGDVDWANHANNLDNSIGAVLSGEEAFNVVMDWVDENNAWAYTAVIVTSDHGHYLVIEDADRLAQAGRQAKQRRK